MRWAASDSQAKRQLGFLNHRIHPDVAFASMLRVVLVFVCILVLFVF